MGVDLESFFPDQLPQSTDADVLSSKVCGKAEMGFTDTINTREDVGILDTPEGRDCKTYSFADEGRIASSF